jgi:predicted metal-binding membrane protein
MTSAELRMAVADASGTRAISERLASEHVFLAVWAMLFALSVAMTIVSCTSMSAMDAMPMPGGWTMSMAWMRMRGQTWTGTAAAFLGMWIVMMAAMMLPSLLPMLRRYRRSVRATDGMHLALLSVMVAAAYFFVWTLLGIAVFPLGIALATIAMRSPALAHAVPLAAGVIVLGAGALQFTAWKVRHLACCREAKECGGESPADIGTAWRHGLRLGLHCCCCCAGLTTTLLVVGVMDLRAMALVTAAITIERFAPAAVLVARAVGIVVAGLGLVLIARAIGLA